MATAVATNATPVRTGPAATRRLAYRAKWGLLVRRAVGQATD